MFDTSPSISEVPGWPGPGCEWKLARDIVPGDCFLGEYSVYGAVYESTHRGLVVSVEREKILILTAAWGDIRGVQFPRDYMMLVMKE